MSLSNNFPTISPSLNLSFALTKALDPRISFVRTTTATYYDGVTTAKAEENLLLQSQDFSTTWAGDGTTITTNTQTAPDGTSTADVLVNTAATEAHYVRQAFTFVAGQTYTLSCFIKKGTVQYVALVAYVNSSNNAGAGFDLDAPSATAGGTGTGYSATNATITSVGNSWYRCSVEVTIGTTVATTFRIWNRNSAYTSGNFFNSYAGLTSDETYLWGAQLEQRSAVSSYTPTTTQPITNYIPVLQTAASGVARFDHNPTTGESLGLLVEEQRTNICLRSEDFSTTWSGTRINTTTNTIVAPDGTLTGDKLIPSTDNDTHRIVQVVTTSAGSWTFSAYLKKGEYSGVEFRIADGVSTVTNSGAKTTVDLLTGSLSSTSFYGANATAGSASIVDVGNDWYRVAVTVTVTSSASNLQGQMWVQSVAGTLSYAGNGYSGLYVWGAQLEAGAFPTSYIPTTSASVTRNADAASMTGTNFSSWFNNAEGTIFVDFVAGPIPPSGFPRAVEFNDSTTSTNFIRVQRYSSGQVRFSITTSGATQAAFDSSTVALGATAKSIVAYKVNDIAGTVNSATPTTDTSAVVPVLTQMNIGDTFAAGANLNSTIKKLAYYPSRLTDAQLQALTS